MTTLYRPAHWQLTDRDAVAEFERQREASLRLTRLLSFWISVGCFVAVAVVIAMVLQ